MKIGSEHLYLILGSLLFTILHFSPNSSKILHLQGSSAPPLVLIENVPGWLYSNDGQDFRITVQSLNKLGYSSIPSPIQVELRLGWGL
jgi:DNA (cytosine-5)-methyltransferase 1